MSLKSVYPVLQHKVNIYFMEYCGNPKNNLLHLCLQICILLKVLVVRAHHNLVARWCYMYAYMHLAKVFTGV